MMIGGIRGDDCEGKGWLVLLFGSLQYLVPRDGHCLRAKLNLNETKKKGGDVADAAWQNPPLRGGEECIGSQAMRECHVRKGV